MTLSKSKSYGRVKAYNVKIYRNRTATYEGIKNVDKVGLYVATISETEYDFLEKLFQDADFSNLDSTYLVNARDIQSKTLGYNGKNVEYHNRAASDTLKNLTKSFDAIVENQEWVKE